MNFLEKFDKKSGPRKNLMGALEIWDSKGAYLFHEETGSVLRCWVSRYGGNAQIDSYNLERYRLPPKKYEKNRLPVSISSDNVDSVKAQKDLVLMFKKYVNFLEKYYKI